LLNEPLVRKYIAMMHSSVPLLFSALIFVTLSVGATSCATAPEKHVREPVKPIDRRTSANPVAPKPQVKTIVRPVVKPQPSEVEYNAFFSRMAIPENDYTISDRQTLASFPPNPSAGTIHEAALVVGLLRDVLTQFGVESANSSPSPTATAQGFKTADTVPSAAVNTTNPNSVVIPPVKPGNSASNSQSAGQVDQSRVIEFRARAVGVDIISALASNPYLKSHSIFNLASDSSHIDGNSQIFVQNLATVIKSEVQLWADMFRRLGLDVRPVVVGASSQDLNPEPVAPVENLNPAVAEPGQPSASTPLTPAQNIEAAKAMSMARELAQKDQREKAIALSRKIPPGADNYAEAQEKTKDWANQIVQELRRQAASQYSASKNNPDAEGKKLNLMKSKTFLEQALSKYPEASTLDTVKENLAIIESEIARLQ
jgi:hypothetical protein